MGRAILCLVGAIAFEVLWAVMLKASQGFTLFWPSLVTVVAYALSAVFLAGACQQLDISLAYAVWTGSGATGVALIGVLVFHERLGVGRAVGLSLVICGVVVLLGLEGLRAPKDEQVLRAPVWDSSIWRPGLENDHQVLGAVHETMPHDPPALVPWYVRLLDSPRSPFALPGAADRFTRDCIRIALGRGLTTQDQAFVLGFTMGASGRCAGWQQALLRFCARRLYRGPQRFSPLDCQVFDFAFEAGLRRRTAPLHRAAFHTLMHRPLGHVRSALGIEASALYLLYDVERVRWPRSTVSGRLPRPASCFPEAQITTQVYFHRRVAS